MQGRVGERGKAEGGRQGVERRSGAFLPLDSVGGRLDNELVYRQPWFYGFVVTAFMRSERRRPDESGHYEPLNSSVTVH